MRLQNAEAIVKLDIKRILPTHIADVLNGRILGGREWDFERIQSHARTAFAFDLPFGQTTARNPSF